MGIQPTFAAEASHPSCEVGSRHSECLERGLGDAPPQGGFVPLTTDAAEETAVRLSYLRSALE